ADVPDDPWPHVGAAKPVGDLIQQAFEQLRLGQRGDLTRVGPLRVVAAAGNDVQTGPLRHLAQLRRLRANAGCRQVDDWAAAQLPEWSQLRHRDVEVVQHQVAPAHIRVDLQEAAVRQRDLSVYERLLPL